jgi:predicted phage terminase large subunit-like protein
LTERLERFREQPLRLLVHAPPRHKKTETLLHFFAWALQKYPELTHAYATYEARLANSKSRIARGVARRAGVELAADAQALHEWRTTAGGGLLATGVRGPLTGQGVSGVLVVDDPVKNRLEAESLLLRDQNWDWFREVARTRMEPGGGIVVVMTRWHEDDLAGRIAKELGWEYLRLPALADAPDDPLGRKEGEPLDPARFDLKALSEIRETLGEYSWSALYQGVPRARGDSVFHDVVTYKALPNPDRPRKYSIGVDLAYSAKTKADWSVAIVFLRSEGFYYILEVIRKQEQAPVFKGRLAGLKARFRSARMRWYASGTEKGVGDFIKQGGVQIEVEPAVADKFIRAQPFAAAWNGGKVLVPEDAPWLDDFLAELHAFTGRGDVHDDQVDAGAAGYDLIAPGVAVDRIRALSTM